MERQDLDALANDQIARLQFRRQIDQIPNQSHDGPHLFTVVSRMGRTVQDVSQPRRSKGGKTRDGSFRRI